MTWFLPLSILVMFTLALVATRKSRRAEELEQWNRQRYIAAGRNRTTPRDDELEP
jgi:hypothetical protein